MLFQFLSKIFPKSPAVAESPFVPRVVDPDYHVCQSSVRDAKTGQDVSLEKLFAAAENAYVPDVAAIHKLRINIKSLAAEARFIRREAKRADVCYREELNYHRRGRLREEARLAHLALAWLRGKPYLAVEPNARNTDIAAPLYNKIKRIVGASNVTLAHIEDWLSFKNDPTECSGDVPQGT